MIRIKFQSFKFCGANFEVCMYMMFCIKAGSVRTQTLNVTAVSISVRAALSQDKGGLFMVLKLMDRDVHCLARRVSGVAQRPDAIGSDFCCLGHVLTLFFRQIYAVSSHSIKVPHKECFPIFARLH